MSTFSPPYSPVEVEFIERREPRGDNSAPGRERRQFANTHEELSPEAAELARAIDQYKLLHRRRFINFEEMLAIVKSLGYSK
jgi:NTP pyrophosphatase (non-canonical NTP hydrolase)